MEKLFLLSTGYTCKCGGQNEQGKFSFNKCFKRQFMTTANNEIRQQFSNFGH